MIGKIIFEAKRRVSGVWGRILLNATMRYYGARTIPVGAALLARRLSFGIDPLVPTVRPVPAQDVLPADLSAAMPDVQLGWWSLGPETLMFLVQRIEVDRPRRVLEFGSGASTVVLGHAMRRLYPLERDLLVSLEQDESWAATTRTMLRDAGLLPYVSVVVAPLRKFAVNDDEYECYDIPSVAATLEGKPFDLVVIDGPRGGPGVRYGTVPLTCGYAGRHCTFYLDDAFRDGELSIAKRWQRRERIRVEGIIVVEKGLLSGRILPPRDEV